MQASTIDLDLLYDDDVRVKNLGDDDQYLCLERMAEEGCFAIDLEKRATENNRFIHAQLEKHRRIGEDRGSECDYLCRSSPLSKPLAEKEESVAFRLPVLGPCLKTWKTQRERREKVKTLICASGRQIRVFEYDKQRLTSYPASTLIR